MPVVTVRNQDEARTIAFAPGPSLLDILLSAGVFIRSGCAGTGGCGLCKVVIEKGVLPPPTRTEVGRVSEADRARGVRLSCQVYPNDDLCLSISEAAVSPAWRPLLEYELPRPSVPDGDVDRPRFGAEGTLGAAIDLGTTHLKLTLWNLSTRRRIGSLCGPNPQGRLGADVMTRLALAQHSREAAAGMSTLIRSALGDALFRMAESAGVSTREIGNVVLVANTAMLCLLVGEGGPELLQPSNWAKRWEIPLQLPAAGVPEWNLAAGAVVDLVPPLAGFVGSDLLAGLLPIGLAQGQEKRLFIDFGTNSEIALWDGQALWTTSAAGGPAFEGCGLSCGMPAEPGAVFRATACETAHGLSFETIGGIPPQGVCGTGWIDILSILRQNGDVDRVGRLARVADGSARRTLTEEPRSMQIRQSDIDLFQRAKAAIGAGITCLLRKAGVAWDQLRWVGIGGALGHHLNVSNAQHLGLLPACASGSVALLGSTALAGAEQMLVCPGTAAQLSALREQSRIVNLAMEPDFETLFVQHLYLEPMRLDSGITPCSEDER